MSLISKTLYLFVSLICRKFFFKKLFINISLLNFLLILYIYICYMCIIIITLHFLCIELYNLSCSFVCSVVKKCYIRATARRPHISCHGHRTRQTVPSCYAVRYNIPHNKAQRVCVRVCVYIYSQITLEATFYWQSFAAGRRPTPWKN